MFLNPNKQRDLPSDWPRRTVRGADRQPGIHRRSATPLPDVWPQLISIRSACPSTYHEFEGSEPIPYDVEGQ